MSLAKRLAILAIVTSSGSLLLCGCGKPAGNRPSTAKPQSVRNQEESEVLKTRPPALYVESKGVGDLSWQVAGRYVLRASGQKLTADEATGKATFRKAKAELFRDGKKAAVVTAERIDADVAGGVLKATGGVIARSAVKDVTASVEELTWSQSSQKIVGSGKVTVTSDVGTLSADRLETNTELDNMKLISNAGGKASLRAATME